MSPPDPLLNPGAHQQHLYISTFHASVTAGHARPLVIPYSLLGPFILPIFYLCIPHARRPWLYNARYAVVALMTALSVGIVRSGTSSANMAVAYATGLMAAWSTMWGATLLLCMSPQFDAARVEKRKRQAGASAGSGGGGLEQNGRVPDDETAGAKGNRGQTAPDESVAAATDKFEYYWQPYPENGSFLERLDWVFDLVTAFRGSGWNWGVSSIPHFKRPDEPQSGELVQLDSIPIASRAGYVRSPTYRSFLLNRAWHIAWGYVVLDFCSVMMMKDPYFIFGPEASHPIPPYLAALHPWALEVSRSVLAFGGVLGALFMVLSFDQVVRCGALGTRVQGVRGDLWHYPSLFGSFDHVFDTGLRGFWGAWWHQSFRLGFTAPTAVMVKHGYLDGDRKAAGTRVVGLFIAFLQSGLLHAVGGMTSIPDTTKAWTPPMFFLLSFVGIVLQHAFCSACRGQIAVLPRAWRRTGNLLFVVLWLHWTRAGFIDDLCRSGLWLYEPVPASPLRALGFGKPGDSWWRWGRHYLPFWHTGEHWWESGIGI